MENNKLREALKKLMDNLKIHAMMPCQQITMNHAEVDAMIEDCRAALAEPVKNCEVGTVEQQARRWHVNCGSGIPNCKHCKVHEQARKSGLVDDKSLMRFDCRFI